MSLYKNKYRIESTRLKGWDYSSDGSYFVTICIHDRDHLLGHIVNGKMVLNQYGIIVNQCWSDLPDHYQNMHSDAFVIMPDHIHGIITICNSPTNDMIDNELINDNFTTNNNNRTNEKFGPMDVHGNDNIGIDNNGTIDIIGNDNVGMMGINENDNIGTIDINGNDNIGTIDNNGNGNFGMMDYNGTMDINGHVNIGTMDNFGNDNIGNDNIGTIDNIGMNVQTGLKPVSTNTTNTIIPTIIHPTTNANTNTDSTNTITNPPVKHHGLFEFIRAFKAFSARRINEMRNTPGISVWQSRFYDHIIRDEGEFCRIQKYIIENPKNWNRDKISANQLMT